MVPLLCTCYCCAVLLLLMLCLRYVVAANPRDNGILCESPPLEDMSPHLEDDILYVSIYFESCTSTVS